MKTYIQLKIKGGRIRGFMMSLKGEEEAREIRRKSANWEFINSLPPKLRLSLVYYIETGNFGELLGLLEWP